MPRADSMRIHGLRPADLASAPTLHEALDHLLGALAGRALVAHVAWVEEGFLSRALREHGVRLYGAPIDTAGLADVVLGRRPGGDPLRLSVVAAQLGLPVHRPHHAEGDALTTAQVFIALATRLERVSGPQTVRSLTLTSRRLRRMRLRH
jgi:DNA polymerase-3 subunit epsilon